MRLLSLVRKILPGKFILDNIEEKFQELHKN